MIADIGSSLLNYWGCNGKELGANCYLAFVQVRLVPWQENESEK